MVKEKRGAFNFFYWNMGGLERSKVRLGGAFFNKSKKLSFAIFWHYVWCNYKQLR